MNVVEFDEFYDQMNVCDCDECDCLTENRLNQTKKIQQTMIFKCTIGTQNENELKCNTKYENPDKSRQRLSGLGFD